MSPTDYTSIAVTAINALPGILALIRANHAQANPDGPPLTDADVIKGLQDAVTSSVAKDEAWKAAHPVSADKPNGTGTSE
jgi:hypothetical protein